MTWQLWWKVLLAFTEAQLKRSFSLKARPWKPRGIEHPVDSLGRSAFGKVGQQWLHRWLRRGFIYNLAGFTSVGHHSLICSTR